ncbi:hypothetical protein HUJ04_006987 [Dendroctonus ponderosae]|nr:hypothetical protein HUJ04_006987 [Dendroctonus ponderosae]
MSNSPESWKVNKKTGQGETHRIKSFGSILFTDEKVFTIERVANDRQPPDLTCEVSDATFRNPSWRRREFRKTGRRRWGGVKINAQIYQERILKDVVISWSRQHFKNRR